MNLMLKVKVFVGVVILIVSVGGLASVYIGNLKNKLKNTQLENQSLTASLNTAKVQLDFEKTQNLLMAQRTQMLNEQLVKSEEGVQLMRDKFNGHDFSKLLAAKPEWMSSKMKKATAKVEPKAVMDAEGVWWIALTPEHYENLAINVQESIKYIKNQQSVIVYYRSCINDFNEKINELKSKE